MEEKTQVQPEQNNEQVLHGFAKSSSFLSPLVISIFILAILAGIGGGYLLVKKGTAMLSTSANPSSSSVTKGSVYGSNDTATFKDMAEGTITNGGIDGEGQFHLVRLGGDSQNVYLTSSLVDLSQFIGKKIKVWGQTQKAQKAGWLMDVGRVEVE